MITKILVTILVIIGCMWMLAARREDPGPHLKTVANPKNQQKQRLFRQAAWSFMLLMVVAAGVMITLELQDENTVVTVHVINTQSGQRISYQARREDIQSNNFTTVGGRKIFTAGIERIEIEAPD
ncbi:MAG: hypothetical protein GY784_11465 [Gammaproteobacteria bacterium]|nr:hypothetical protein [Gammaproteobacteria bacterium]